MHELVCDLDVGVPGRHDRNGCWTGCEPNDFYILADLVCETRCDQSHAFAIGLPKKFLGLPLPHSAGDSNGRTTWIVDAHRDDGKRFAVHADEKLTAFLDLESAIRAHHSLKSPLC